MNSRNSKCSAVQKLIGKIVSVQCLRHKLGDTKHIADSSYREYPECRVETVNTQFIRLRVLGSERNVTEPLEHVTVSYDEEKHRPMLVVTGY